MTKRAFLIAAVALLAAGLALAATPPPANPPLNGTITAIKGTRVDITVEGEKPAWVKKGSGIKLKGGLGKIVEVTATGVAFNTKKASTLAVGEKVVVEKGTVVPEGC